jgi:hypothetical protein
MSFVNEIIHQVTESHQMNVGICDKSSELLRGTGFDFREQNI